MRRGNPLIYSATEDTFSIWQRAPPPSRPCRVSRGRKSIPPYCNFIVACLFHDIGCVRGIVKGDDASCFVADASGRKVSLPRGASDAALTPYHVERSKLFVLDRLAEVEELDAKRIEERPQRGWLTSTGCRPYWPAWGSQLPAKVQCTVLRV